MSAQVIDVIAGVIATTRHPKTGELMVGRGAKKRAAAILAALNAAGFVVEQGWQPIETAPRDGTRVLVYAPPVASSEYETARQRVDWWGEPDGWQMMRPRQPYTHWRPLPTPPEAQP